jgi:hypothetical protein
MKICQEFRLQSCASLGLDSLQSGRVYSYKEELGLLLLVSLSLINASSDACFVSQLLLWRNKDSFQEEVHNHQLLGASMLMQI